MLVRADDVLEERLVRPHDLDLAASILNERGEESEVGAPRLLKMAMQDLAGHGRHLSRPQSDDRLHPAAILVPHRKAEQEIVNRREARLLQIGGLARTYALQELQWRLQDVIRHVWH